MVFIFLHFYKFSISITKEQNISILFFIHENTYTILQFNELRIVQRNDSSKLCVIVMELAHLLSFRRYIGFQLLNNFDSFVLSNIVATSTSVVAIYMFNASYVVYFNKVTFVWCVEFFWKKTDCVTKQASIK